jgi:hypothetical protein
MPSYSCHAQNLRFLAAEGNGKERTKIRHFQKPTPAYQVLDPMKVTAK